LYSKRQIEDNSALKSVGIKITNLNYTEALWRKKKNPNSPIQELNHIYPTYKFHIIAGKISPLDFTLIEQISTELKNIIPIKSVVFCPYGLGNHVDHLIVKSAVENFTEPILMADQPYITRDIHTLKNLSLEAIEFEKQKSYMLSKRELINKYKTQLCGLFVNKNIPDLPEYIIKPNTLTINGYKLVKKINSNYKSKYITGIYKNKYNKKVFIKKVKNNSSKILKYWLKNEINCNKLISNKFNLPKTTIIPKMVDYCENESKLYIVSELIDASNLINSDNNASYNAIKKVLGLIEYINRNYQSEIFASKLIIRSQCYWIIILPILVIKAFYKHPKYRKTILKTMIKILINTPQFITSKEKGFVHRDLGLWNILVNKNNTYLIDFQLACISNPILDYAILLLKIFINQPLSEMVLKMKTFRSIFSDSKQKNIFITFGLLMGLYDLSLFDGNSPYYTNNYLNYLLNI
jgi:hypothetical protein